MKAPALLLFVVVGITFLITGCEREAARAGAGGEGAADARAVARIAQGLEAGEAELHVTGAAVDAEDPDASDPLFQTAPRGTNAEGPYIVRVFKEASLEGGEPENVYVNFILPGPLEPGTHDLTRTPGADGQIVTTLIGGGMAWQFNRNVEGVLEVAEFGGRFTGSWEFTAEDSEERSVTVTGRAHAIPFHPVAEGHYTRVVDGEEEQFEGRATAVGNGRDRRTLYMGPRDQEVLFYFPADLEPGRHRVSLEAGDPEAPVRVSIRDVGHVESVDGYFEFTTEDRYTSGSFSVTAEGERQASVDGAFEHAAFDGR